ncbi:MAG: hypothetical protein ACOY90_01095 [Candidatus Zhuqueibacterota bacterium]
MKIQRRVLLAIILFLFVPGRGSAQSLSRESRVGSVYVRCQATFDLYKPYSSLYLGLQRPRIMESGRERAIYAELLKRLFLPKYFLIQATLYPFSAWSSHWETSHYNWYRRFQIYGSINGLRTLGSGNEEPYAMSLFLGNIIRLAYRESDADLTHARNAGSALAGFLLSGGNHFIHNNIYLIGRWYQAELMLIGISQSPQQRLFWNFRIGTKVYQDCFLSNALTVSLERNSTDYQTTGFSLLKNSILKYQAKLPLQHEDTETPASFQMVSIAKKFPVRLGERTAFLVIGAGVKWESLRRYDHTAGGFEASYSNQLVWLFTPNMEF